MAFGENVKDTDRSWVLLLDAEERQAVLNALHDYYNNPDRYSQALRAAAYEVAHALGRILQFTSSGQSAVELEEDKT